MQLGTETGSLVNHIWANSKQPVPEIGLGCTILMWTDRKAATIIEVHSNKQGVVKEIILQEDIATRTDGNEMSDSQCYVYTPNPNGAKRTARLLKAGWKILDGKDSETGRNVYGYTVGIGYRCAYFDYSF